MLKKILLLISIIYSGGVLSDEDKSQLPDPITSSAHQLFIKSDGPIEKTPISNPDYEGDHSYNLNLNLITESIFKSRISGLYDNYSDRINTGGGRQSYIRFDENELVTLGIDLNFDVGNILSSDTRIIRIGKTKRSQIVDGKIDNSASNVDHYSILYKTIQNDREQTISVGHSIYGEIRGYDFDVSFRKQFSSDSYMVYVRDKKSPVIMKTEKIRANDVIHLDRELNVNIEEEIKLEMERRKKLTNENNIEESNIVINVLFVAERFFLNQHGGLTPAWYYVKGLVNDSLIEMNEAIHASGVPNNVWVISSLTVDGITGMALRFAPTSLPCNGYSSTACNETYSISRDNIMVNEDVLQWKLDYESDLTMLLRVNFSHISANSDGDGLSPELLFPKPEHAKKAFGVARLHPNEPFPKWSQFQTENIVHELGHLMGAGHSDDNFWPGDRNNDGFNSAFMHTTGCSLAHWHGVRTIMTYGDVCMLADKQAWLTHWPTNACGSKPETCIPVRRFSNESGTVFHDGHNLRFGDSVTKNVYYMIHGAPIIAEFSDYLRANIPNKNPIPIFTTSSNNGNFLSSMFTFDASQSSDPENDPLTYTWFINNSVGTQVAYSTKEILVYKFEDIGNYTVTLGVQDNRGGVAVTNKMIEIIVEPVEPLGTPYISSYEFPSDFSINWSPISRATSYEITPSVFNGEFMAPWSITTNSFIIPKTDMTEDVHYYFTVKACIDVSCSPSSNLLSIMDDGISTPPPPSCNPGEICEILPPELPDLK